MRPALLAAPAAALALLALAAFAGAKPVSIALPGDMTFAFKKAPGVEVVSANCSSCHSAAYVSTQPPLTRAQWTAEVVKMKAAYGAPIADADVPKIAEYLTANYGKP